MKARFDNGYSSKSYVMQFDNVVPRILMCDGVETRYKFDPDTNRPVSTGEVDSKRVWLYYPGLGIQALKLPADFKLPKDINDLDEIELINPEACIIGHDIYVRATTLRGK